MSSDHTHTWDISKILASESRAQGQLYAADPAFRLSGPDDLLLQANQQGKVAADRMIVIGGEISALLLGFAIIAAVGLRRGLTSERRRLLSRGARRWQVEAARIAEVCSLTASGALGGVLTGTILVAVIAASEGQPVTPILGHVLGSGETIGLLALGWLLSSLLLVLTAVTREADPTQARRLTTADVAAIGALATIGVSVSRGSLNPSNLSQGNLALLLMMPVLISFAFAVGLARVLAPAMRLSERAGRRSTLSLRLAFLALSRAPTRTIVSCAFFAVAIGLAIFAGTYRTTLERGARDQADFQAPFDFLLSEGTALVPALDVGGLSRYERIAGVRQAYAVLRVGATTPGLGSTVLAPTVLALPPQAVRQMRWRTDNASLPLSKIASDLQRAGTPQLAGATIPAAARVVHVEASVHGSGVIVGLAVSDRRGRTRIVDLGRIDRGKKRLSAALPSGPLRLVGVVLTLPASEQFFLAHRETENGTVSVAPSGTLNLGPLYSSARDGRTDLVSAFSHWEFPSGQLTGQGATVTLHYAFRDTGSHLILRPAEPTDDTAAAAVVSSDIAAAAGGVDHTITLNLGDSNATVEIVGVAKRMPSVPADSGPFVLTNEPWLQTVINSAAPGEGDPNEIWLSSADTGATAAALSHRPFDQLQSVSRQTIEAGLSSDPLARTTVRTLAAAAIAALILGVFGFWVGLMSELRDERSDFYDLEVRGLPPAELKRQIRLRSTILIGAGLAAGIGLGAILAELVVSFIRVSATTALPEPPLLLSLSWWSYGVGLVAVLLGAAAVNEVTVHIASRGERAVRASWSLE